MKKIILVVLALFFVNGCILGSDGKDGAPGKSAFVHQESGVLFQTNLVDGHWDIVVGLVYLQKRTVQVWVRSGSGYMWQTPTWYLSESVIRIMNDSLVRPQWEYQIITNGE